MTFTSSKMKFLKTMSSNRDDAFFMDASEFTDCFSANNGAAGFTLLEVLTHLRRRPEA